MKEGRKRDENNFQVRTHKRKSRNYKEGKRKRKGIIKNLEEKSNENEKEVRNK